MTERYVFLTLEMDERLGSLIGIEESENRLYGYDNDMKTVLVSTDAGVTWSGADVARLSIDKLKSWTAAIDVPLDQSFDLDQATPTSIYTFSSWGGMLPFFYAPPQKVAGYYVIPSELLSVRPSVSG